MIKINLIIMKKGLKNWIANIFGLIMMLVGAGMILIESPIMYIILMFGLGTLLFVSFTKLGDIFLEVIKGLLKMISNYK